MTPTEAQLAYVEEFAAESRDLMRRALAYAAQKRADEYQRAMNVEVRDEGFAGRSAEEMKASRAVRVRKAKIGRTNARTRNVLYSHNGETRLLRDWANYLGIPYGTLYGRISRGLSFEEAVKLGVQKRGQHWRERGRGRSRFSDAT